MNPSSFLQKGFENIWRNRWLSFSTITVIAVMLVIVNLLLTIFLTAEQAFDALKNKITLTVYLKDNIDFYRISQVVSDLERLPQIKPPVEYTSSEDAANLIIKTFSLKSDAIQKYKLTPPASITVTLRSPSDYRPLQKYLLEGTFRNLFRTPPGGDQSKAETATSEVAENLIKISRFAFQTFLWVSLGTILGTILIITHTIHATVLLRRREIEIMKLVGAEKKTIETPFLMEAILYSITAFFLGVVFFLLSLKQFPKNPLLEMDFSFLPNIFLVELTLLLLLSITVTAIVTRRYLHKKLFI